jgi:hypothetical protein
MADAEPAPRAPRGVRKNGVYRCRRCRQGKAGCIGKAYRRHGCGGPKKAVLHG